MFFCLLPVNDISVVILGAHFYLYYETGNMGWARYITKCEESESMAGRVGFQYATDSNDSFHFTEEEAKSYSVSRFPAWRERNHGASDEYI